MIDRFLGAFARFFVAALFGLAVSWAILDLGLDLAGLNAAAGRVWIVAVIGAPIVCGILGMFFFEKFLGGVTRVFKEWSDGRWL